MGERKGKEEYDGEEGGRGEYSTSSYNVATYKVKKAVSLLRG